ncbi:MAG: type II toxin-antitoxin system RelE/ParE family toxin [Methylobacter tundripaludum]|nr:type II toxin-antitoxin system RelE/ParE family toxin [Methylobacter tundripaludum]
MRFVLLPSAKEDLKEIRQYIAKENPSASKMVSERIKKSLLMLIEQPLIGHVTDDEDVLEWHIPGLPYTLPYRIVNNEIQILRVFHEAQNRPGKWECS